MASCVLLYCVVLHDLFTYTAARVANKLTYILTYLLSADGRACVHISLLNPVQFIKILFLYTQLNQIHRACWANTVYFAFCCINVTKKKLQNKTPYDIFYRLCSVNKCTIISVQGIMSVNAVILGTQSTYLHHISPSLHLC